MWGKILAGAAVGVGAVAAAPFTGGGSLLGGASLIASLTGAGTISLDIIAAPNRGVMLSTWCDIKISSSISILNDVPYNESAESKAVTSSQRKN